MTTFKKLLDSSYYETQIKYRLFKIKMKETSNITKITPFLIDNLAAEHQYLTAPFVFYKNCFYKNHETQNCQKIKNIPRIMLRSLI